MHLSSHALRFSDRKKSGKAAAGGKRKIQEFDASHLSRSWLITKTGGLVISLEEADSDSNAIIYTLTGSAPTANKSTSEKWGPSVLGFATKEVPRLVVDCSKAVQSSEASPRFLASLKRFTKASSDPTDAVKLQSQYPYFCLFISLLSSPFDCCMLPSTDSC